MRSDPRVRGLGICAALVLTLLSGCSKSPFNTAPVTVSLSLDGEPLSGGRVVLMPVMSADSLETGKPGIADIGPDGTAPVSTYGSGDGAVVGDHTAKVINTEPDSEAGRRLRVQRISVPGRWTVAADQENEVNIELTSEMIAKYGRKAD